jgi:very-short-patch-repair endonuclease
MQRNIVEARVTAAWPKLDVLTAAELTEVGIGERLRMEAVRWGVVLRIRRGAYVLAALWKQSTHKQQNLMRIRAHFLTTPHAGAYSHTTAARLHHLYIWSINSTIHLSQPFSSTRRSSGGDVQTHNRVLPAGETVVLQGPRGRTITATSLERTVLDCARELELHRAVIIGDHALRLGASLSKMEGMVNAMPGAPGIRKARNVLSLLDGRSESPGETRTRLLLRTFGIPMPEPQVRLSTRHGDHRVDFAWKEIRLILEFDGRSKYFDYRPTDQVILDERKRENALTEVHWNFFRVDWSDLSNPEELKARIIKAMERAAARTAALRLAT